MNKDINYLVFTYFLEKHNLTEKFMHNFNKHHIGNNSNFYNWIKNTDLKQYQYISSAFLWSETEEKDKFWSGISKLWRESEKKHQPIKFKIK